MTAVEAQPVDGEAPVIDLKSVFDAVGHGAAELVTVCSQPPRGRFQYQVVPFVRAASAVQGVRDGRNVWFSVNPIRPVADGRGKASDVVRLAALYADLDVKAAGMPTPEDAHAVVDRLSAMLGQRPTALIHSGHGLQPVWAVETDDQAARFDPDGPSADPRWTEATVLMRRWGRLVAHVAGLYGGRADPVWDLARLLRCPATVNMKDPDAPVAATAELPGGAPLSVEQIADALTAADVPELPSDRRQPTGEVLSPPEGWAWAGSTHPYVTAMVAGWARDTPENRHPWLVGCSVRLACAWRARRITEADHAAAVTALEDRFLTLLATTGEQRDPHPGEVADAFAWGRARTATFSDDEVGAELGDRRRDGRDLVATPPPGPAPRVTDLVATRALPVEDPVSRFAFRDGGSFLFDIPDHVPAVWGDGTDVLWAEGEALMLVGSTGVGKSTVAGQLVRGRLGLSTSLLGFSVAAREARVLYLAMDRPRQIARNLRRMFRPDERATVSRRLEVWEGPPPADLAKFPDTLLEMVVAAGADTVVVDSLKDAAIGLTDDEVAAGYNRARQKVIAAGIEILELHHQVKRGANGGRPDTLADVYGSVWLTGGAGSVVLLDGLANDSVVNLKHLKTPAAEVGPMKVRHDHAAGVSTVFHKVDLLAIARASVRGLTVRDAARALCETDNPTDSQKEKARRQLDSLVTAKLLERQGGGRGGARGSREATYHAAGPGSLVRPS